MLVDGSCKRKLQLIVDQFPVTIEDQIAVLETKDKLCSLLLDPALLQDNTVLFILN